MATRAKMFVEWKDANGVTIERSDFPIREANPVTVVVPKDQNGTPAESVEFKFFSSGPGVVTGQGS